MRYHCPDCQRKYYEKIDKCIFCSVEIKPLEITNEAKVRSFTQVNIHSSNHKKTPYYCVLAEDEQGNLFIKKEKNAPILNQKILIGENSFNSKQTLAVIGTGPMGEGIVKLALKENFQVILVSRSLERLEQAKERITLSLSKFLCEEEKELTLKRLKLTINLSEIATADLIIETVKEDLEVKKELFKRLDSICKPETIIVTNTSSLSVTDLAKEISNPSRVAGLHFSNPPEKMDMAEIVKTEWTTPETIKVIKKIAESLGKEPTIANDSPGFIHNRILAPYLLEAVHLFEKGIAKEDIDKTMKSGSNYPLGPLEVIDLIGLDVFNEMVENIYQATAKEKFKVPEIIGNMINEGKLGRKTGEGFYSYKKIKRDIDNKKNLTRALNQLETELKIKELTDNEEIKTILTNYQYLDYDNVKSLSNEQIVNLKYNEIVNFNSEEKSKLFSINEGGEIKGLIGFQPMLWDTEHFGFKVALLKYFIVTKENNDKNSDKSVEYKKRLLEFFDNWCKEEKIKLAYARLPSEDINSIHTLELEGYNYMENRLHLHLPLKNFFKRSIPPPGTKFVEFLPEYKQAALALVPNAMTISRFHKDPLTRERADEVYHRWIRGAIENDNKKKLALLIDGNFAGFFLYNLKDVPELNTKSLWLEFTIINPKYKGRGLGYAFYEAVMEKEKANADFVEGKFSLSNKPVLKIATKLKANLIFSELTFHKRF